MEMIVFYNKGKDAARDGLPREAPETIEYPVISNYRSSHCQTVRLSDYAKREWLSGYDARLRMDKKAH